MGSDMHFYVQEVALRSHGGLVQALKKARAVIDPVKHPELIKEIDKALANAAIQ